MLLRMGPENERRLKRKLAELREYLRAEGESYKTIRETGDLAGDVEETIKAEVEKFQGSFSIQETATV